MLLIYLPQHTNRSKYIFDKIFTEELGLSYDTTGDKGFFEKYTGEKINYSGARFSNEIFICASGLLSENIIRQIDLALSEINGVKTLFLNDSSCSIGFDIFSATFYMLSRYEEYLPFVPDQYGRFDAKDAVSFRHGFLQMPVVDRWIELLKNALQKHYKNLSFRSSVFRAIVTYDIDVAYKFRGRSFHRTLGGIGKDIINASLSDIRTRNLVLRTKEADPWDTYDYLKHKIFENRLESIFFFLVGDYSKYDRNLDYESPLMQHLVNEIASFSEIGIHPSFYSSSSFEKIKEEKKRLEKISEKKIVKSRQHFLKFRLPDTYNYLIEAGIREDYSMGFPYESGFRAGTCKPFRFYDLKNETATDLTIFPITMMEGNFMKDKKCDKEKIIQTINALILEAEKVNGIFLSIWHNHSVGNSNEYRDWRYIHDKMLEKIIELSR